MSIRVRSVPSILVTLGTYMNAFSQWYLVWLFARTSGAAAAGDYASLFAYATPIFTIAHFGLRDHYLTSKIRYSWGAYVGLRAAGLIAGTLAMVFLVQLLNLPTGLSLAIVALKIANGFLDLFNGKIQRARNFLALGVLSLANAVVTMLAATSAVALTDLGVTIAVWLSSSVSLACAVAAWSQIPRSHTSPTGLTKTDFTGISKDAAPITVSQTAFALSSSLPIMVVERLGNPSSVGVFAAAAYLLTVANLTGAAVRLIEIPHLTARYESHGWRSVRERVNRLALRYLIVGLLGAVLAVAVGPPVLEVVYGPQFTIGRGPLLGLAIAAAFTIPGYLLTAELLTTNAYRSQSVIGVVSLLFALGLAVVMGTVTGVDAMQVGAITALTAKAVQVSLTLHARKFRPNRQNSTHLDPQQNGD